MAKVETQYVLVGRDKTKRAFSSFRRNAQGASRAVRNLGLAFGGLTAGVAIRSIAEAGLTVERLQRGLRVATGSAEAAAREFQFVSRTSNRLGLEIESTAAAYTKLAAAARGTALQGQQTREIFLGVSSAARVLGLSADQTQGALTAIEQIISKGKVSAEELRGQLGERLPGAFQIAARSIGVTTQELDKMLRNGDLLAEDLLPALARELQNTFGPGVAEASRDTASAFARLKNRTFELAAALADKLNPALASTADTLRGLLGGFTLAEEIEQTKNKIVELNDQLNNLGSNRESGTQRFFLTEQIREATDRLRELGIELANRNRLEAAQKEIVTLYEETRASIRGVKESLTDASDELDRYIKNQEAAAEAQRRFAAKYDVEQRYKRAADSIDEASDALDEFFEKQEKEAEKVNKAAEDLGFTFQSAFEDAIVEGRELSDVLKGLYKDLLRIFVRRQISEPLFGGLSAALGGIFSKRAIGGAVGDRKPYVVGERGPEVFIPRGAGKIVPNSQLGGGVTNVYNFEAGADVATIRAEIIPLLEQTRRVTLNDVAQLQREGRL